MSQKLYEELKSFKENPYEVLPQEAPEEEQTWLVFKAGSSSYAIESFHVREILKNNQVFPLPFVPPYIKGLLNCYGQPYAIVDFNFLQNQEEQKSKLFMILNDENNLSLQITDIVEFQTLPRSAVSKETSLFDSQFFLGSIPFNEEDVPIINLQAITSRIKSEIENK